MTGTLRPDDPLMTVGVIGAGSISDAYYARLARAPAFHLKCCAARGMESARRQAAKYGCQPVTFEQMLDDRTIDLIVNLTPAVEHLALSRRILEAGKHLYTEKPFALSLADGREMVALAEAKGLRIGSAPDTFFGGGHQAGRTLVDAGAIGRPVLGAAFVGVPGIEQFHPNPAPFYQPGCESPYEIGPYFITQLVNLLGPVAHVAAEASHGPATRRITSQPRAGETFEVAVPTSFHAILGFCGGASVTLTMSLDVWRHDRHSIELFGTEGALCLPDPNFFGGDILHSVRGQPWRTIGTSDHALGLPNKIGHQGQNLADYRGVGIVDMAVAIRDGRAHRTQPDLVLHVLDVIETIMLSVSQSTRLGSRTTCERPTPVSASEDREMLALFG